MATTESSDDWDLLDWASPFLINMETRADRLRESLTDLSWACGRSIEVETDIQLVRPQAFVESAGFASPAFRSCLHAHLDSAKRGLEQRVQRLLVLEDDLHFDHRWSEFAPALIAQLDELDWDIVNLGYLEGKDAPAPGPIFGLERFDGEVIGSQAYVVNGPFLPKWIQHLEAIVAGVPGDRVRGPMGPDAALNTMTWAEPDTRRYLANPSLIGQRPSRSDISPRFLDRVMPDGRAMTLVRGVRKTRSVRRRS